MEFSGVTNLNLNVQLCPVTSLRLASALSRLPPRTSSAIYSQSAGTFTLNLIWSRTDLVDAEFFLYAAGPVRL